jgi:subtilisin
VIPGRYIVVLEDSVARVTRETQQRERRLGFERRFVYRSALKGFAARLTPGAVEKLRDDPEVDFVSQDRHVEAAANVPLVGGEPTPPTGVRRIASATTSTAREPSGVSVAVLDTGIQLDHPDLNAADGTNCTSPGAPADDNAGHGTAVAGIIGAKNNGFGVVGVAPDTTVVAVKVLANGGGTASTVLCGIDWVTANASAMRIGVANMSLGSNEFPLGTCASTGDPVHRAICNSTAAGVNYVHAAGNDDLSFDDPPRIAAAYPEVLTVTAISDTDGQPGGLGDLPSCAPGEGEDDTPATFSNFASTLAGAVHTIAAPGVCVESTAAGGGYGPFGGTSGAAPHVAGVVALCMNEAGIDGPCASKSPAEVIPYLLDRARAYNEATPSYGFFRDPLHSPLSGRHYGFLTRTLPPTPPALANTAPPAISGEPRVGQVLSASPGGWTGLTPITHSYVWQRCDPAGEACATIANAAASTSGAPAAGPTYGLRAADVGRRLRVVVSATNPLGTRSATSEPSAVITGPPVNTSRPRISGKPRVGRRLRARRGTWTSATPITYRYSWFRCNRRGRFCLVMRGRKAVRKVRRSDRGKRLRVQVTATNAHGRAKARSAPTRVVRG